MDVKLTCAECKRGLVYLMIRCLLLNSIYELREEPNKVKEKNV